MTSVIWDPKARDFLRKLEKAAAKRIFEKIDLEVSVEPTRFLESLSGLDFYKIRIGDYRIFADYSKGDDILTIRSIRHRKDAYKKHNLQ